MSEEKTPVPQLQDGTVVVEFKTKPNTQWPALTGTVSPATPVELRAYDARSRLLNSKINSATTEAEIDAATKAVIKAQAKFYADHIKTWNIAKPITPDTVAQLPDEIFSQLDSIVAGYGGLILGNSEGTSSS